MILSRNPTYAIARTKSFAYMSIANPSSIRLASSSVFSCSAESASSELARLSCNCVNFRAPIQVDRVIQTKCHFLQWYLWPEITTGLPVIRSQLPGETMNFHLS